MMTATDLCGLVERLKLNKSQASMELEISRAYLTKMMNGESRIPRHIALACAALAYGLPPYRGD